MPRDSAAEALFEAVVIGRNIYGTEDFEHELWPLLKEAATFGRKAFDEGIELLEGDLTMRRVGCHILGLVCNPDTHGWGDDVAAALCELAKTEKDSKVCDALASALGHTAAEEGVATLIGLTSHPDPEVRRSAVSSLPFCVSDGEAGSDVIETLLALMEDDIGRVRDFATFGLSQLLCVDSTTIREAFIRHLNDEDEDTQIEAVFGLARRRDRRALPTLISFLESGNADFTLVLAAAYLADGEIQPYLKQIELNDGDYRTERLVRAIRACDPLETAFETAAMEEFVRDLGNAIELDHPDYRIGLACELLSLDIVLRISGDSFEEIAWPYEEFMRRSDNNIDKALANLFADIRQVIASAN